MILGEFKVLIHRIAVCSKLLDDSRTPGVEIPCCHCSASSAVARLPLD